MNKLIALLAVAALVACGESKENAPADDGQDAHAHAAKHDGELTELGSHEGFLETKLDHGAGTLKVWIYVGEEMKDTRPASAPVLNLMTKDGPKTLTAMEDDGAWVFADAALKGEPESARFRFTAGGKTYTPSLAHSHAPAEAHEHEHEHDATDEVDAGHEHDATEGHEHGKEDAGHGHEHEEKDG